MKITFASALVMTLAVLFGGVAEAAPARDAKNVVVKIEPIKTDDTGKKQEDRMNAVNRALEQSLNERAKSQSDFEKTQKQFDRIQHQEDRLAVREQVSERAARAMDLRLDSESREVRAMNRDLREESRREKRLNWLND